MGQLIYSFIIPVYNCEKYLEECIASIQVQKLKGNYEIILVDDGSTDGSGLLCDKLAKRFQEIQTFHKENGGASSARNYGIHHANGKYILFIDGDDTLDENLIAHIEQEGIKDDALVIYGMSFDYYSEDKIERTDIYSYTKEGYIDREQISTEFKRFFACNSLSSSCNKVFIREIIEKNHIQFDESMNLYEDFEFVLRYLNCVNRIYCIKEGYYHYRLFRQENHLKNRINDFSNLMRNLKKIGDRIEQLGMGEETFADLIMQLWYMHLLYAGDLDSSIQKIMRIYHEDEKIRSRLKESYAFNNNERQLLLLLIGNKNKTLKLWILKNRIRIQVRGMIRSTLNKIKN